MSYLDKPIGIEKMQGMSPDEPQVDSMAGSVSFSIEEIKHYLTGLCLVGEHKENDMLNCAISLLEDYEDGIEAVLERRKQNDGHELTVRKTNGKSTGV